MKAIQDVYYLNGLSFTVKHSLFGTVYTLQVGFNTKYNQLNVVLFQDGVCTTIPSLYDTMDLCMKAFNDKKDSLTRMCN